MSTFDEWLDEGRRKGWISGPICATHDGIPGTEEEEAAWEEGLDPCQHILRLWAEGERPSSHWDVALEQHPMPLVEVLKDASWDDPPASS